MDGGIFTAEAQFWPVLRFLKLAVAFKAYE